MCVISQILCPQCGRKPQGYLYAPCWDFIHRVGNQPDELFGQRLSCSNFAWPIPGKIPVKLQHCEDCIHRPSHSNTSFGIDGLNGKITAAGLSNVITNSLSRHNEVIAEDAKRDDRQHRQLTLRIPFCDLCKKPYCCMSDNENSSPWDDEVESADQYQNKLTIQGIEFEFSSILWKWVRLVALWKVEGHDAIETTLQTGYIHRPCDTCINRETVLRGKVSLFVERCGPEEAWAVWMWLMMRGSGQVNFWWHELSNIGLPNLPPPSGLEYRTLMGAGWKARTGIAWEDIYDVELGEYPLHFTPHREVFTNLSQWNTLGRIRHQPHPVAVLPPPLLDTNNVTIEYDPAAEQKRHQGEVQHEHQQKQTNSMAKKRKHAGSETPCLKRARSPLTPSTPTSNVKSRESNEGHERPAKRLRFSNEVKVLDENSQRAPQVEVAQLMSSPGDSDETLVDSSDPNSSIEFDDPDDSNDDLFDDTVAVLTTCQFGFYHVRNMDADCVWQLPLGIETQEDKPVVSDHGEQPKIVKAEENGQQVEDALQQELAVAVQEEEQKQQEDPVQQGELKQQDQQQELSQQALKEQETNQKYQEQLKKIKRQQQKAMAAKIQNENQIRNGQNGKVQGGGQKKRAGSGLSGQDPEVLSSDESSVYSDSD